MTTAYVTTSEVVNADHNRVGDGCCHVWQSFPVETLAQRLQWVIDNGYVPSARQWALRANLSHSTVSLAIARGSEVAPSRLKALAETAKVSFAWLAVGEGYPNDEPAPPAKTDYKRLEIAIADARKKGKVTSGAIDAAMVLRGDRYLKLSVPEWYELLLELTIDDIRRQNETIRVGGAHRKLQKEAREKRRLERDPEPRRKAIAADK